MYTRDEMVEAFVRGYGAARYRGSIEGYRKLSYTSRNSAEEICERWLERYDSQD